METKEEILQCCTIEGNVVKLPNVTIERKLYLEVKKSLELIGGKWQGGKIFGFVFKNDPTYLLNEVASGIKRNLKKEFQFFPTPKTLAKKLVSLADLQEEDLVLEPSAGQGAILDAICGAYYTVTFKYCEIMPENVQVLRNRGFNPPIIEDFLQLNAPEKFNRIVANPPFSNNQDIIHIRKMYECLKPGGRIVSIASNHWRNSKNKQDQQFRNWLSELNAEIIELEPGTFKESGINVAACIVIINK